MNYEYEKLCAARSLLDDMIVVEDWLYWRRRNLIEDLVALEREQDERALRRRRARNKLRLVRLNQDDYSSRFRKAA